MENKEEESWIEATEEAYGGRDTEKPGAKCLGTLSYWVNNPLSLSLSLSLCLQTLALARLKEGPARWTGTSVEHHSDLGTGTGMGTELAADGGGGGVYSSLYSRGHSGESVTSGCAAQEKRMNLCDAHCPLHSLRPETTSSRGRQMGKYTLAPRINMYIQGPC